MSLPPDVDRPVETVERAIDIIDYLKENGPATIAEVTAHLGCAKSTAHRHLKTLEASSFLIEENDEYRLGIRFLDYGVIARDRHTFYREVKSKVDTLADETDEKIWCAVEEHGRSVHIYGAQGKRSVRTYARLGHQNYLHQHAAGKAILAYLPDERIDEIVETYGLPARTQHTITTADELWDEIEAIRERGYALNIEESVEGLHAIGAPIKDENGTALGAISISGPANRLDGSFLREELPTLLLGTVNEITINLAHA
ncbi:IclR family transcriptional regulator [Natrinema hispanicum]|uniref:DNA-binding transcriptional regulator, IclR family n=1 Tax=Natrinema hispanicum TaxID=392421 RepID=A0A1I0IFE4_9EURY|nr:IclR family transcriptional regulator [Natrinema hispanicum]SET94748.1 DNA-binding transcriptional regulator, IclR family [Natrinema hispanicum]